MGPVTSSAMVWNRMHRPEEESLMGQRVSRAGCELRGPPPPVCLGLSRFGSGGPASVWQLARAPVLPSASPSVSLYFLRADFVPGSVPLL